MEPHSSFHEAFSAELRNRICEILWSVSDAAVDNFSAAPDLTTGMTFGVDLYQFTNQAFLKAAQEPGALFSAGYTTNGAFRCRAGEWDFGLYRVGRSKTESIWESFPNPNNSAGEIGGLFLPGFAPSIDSIRGAIVAYMCDAEDGLAAVYLCVPESSANGKISSWLYAEKLWTSEDTPSSNGRQGREVVPAEQVDAVTVKRRDRGQTSAG